jgi:hypothetical protein
MKHLRWRGMCRLSAAVKQIENPENNDVSQTNARSQREKNYRDHYQ